LTTDAEKMHKEKQLQKKRAKFAKNNDRKAGNK
jgi:hypothetical protein